MNRTHKTGFRGLAAREVEALLWLRERRNQLVHYQGTTDGMTGRYHTKDAAYLMADAEPPFCAIAATRKARDYRLANAPFLRHLRNAYKSSGF